MPEMPDSNNSNALNTLDQWFPTGGSRTRFQWVARLCLGKKKVQKNDHALILKGSESIIFTVGGDDTLL